jgi:hypothetical protein
MTISPFSATWRNDVLKRFAGLDTGIDDINTDLADKASLSSTTAQTFAARLEAPIFRSVLAILSDDTAFSVSDLPANVLFTFIVGNPNSTPAGLGAARPISNAAPNMIVASNSTSIATFLNTALSGTTGTDGKLNFSCNADNKLYVENRLGINIIAALAFFA